STAAWIPATSRCSGTSSSGTPPRPPAPERQSIPNAQPWRGRARRSRLVLGFERGLPLHDARDAAFRAGGIVSTSWTVVLAAGLLAIGSSAHAGDPIDPRNSVVEP